MTIHAFHFVCPDTTEFAAKHSEWCMKQRYDEYMKRAKEQIDYDEWQSRLNLNQPNHIKGATP